MELNLVQLARVKSRMKWTGHMVRMKDERSPKRSETKKQEGFIRQGRRQLKPNFIEYPAIHTNYS